MRYSNDELNELEAKIKVAKLRGEVWVATYDEATALIAELRREREKVRLAVEALEFYSRPDIWHSLSATQRIMQQVGGEKARAALDKIRESNG